MPSNRLHNNRFQMCRYVPVALIATLSASLATPADLVAQTSAVRASNHVPRTRGTGKLTPQQRADHTLNRLTFGPLPGEAAQVERMGLDRWLDGQLHPDTVDDSAFEQRLADFPALQLSQADLFRRFPSPGMLRVEARRGSFAPVDPVERAIYADAMAAYEARKEAKAQDGTVQGGGTTDSETKDLKTRDWKTEDSHELKPSIGGEMAAASIATSSKQQARQEQRRERAANVSDSEVQALLALAPEARFDRLVTMTPDRMLDLRAALRPAERVRLLDGLTPVQAESVEAMGGAPARVVGAELLQARLLRDLDSRRQLQAVMVDFWLNHFNIYDRKNQNEPYLLPAFERDVILPHALGHFEDLLIATAKSPAMLMYLDNWLSIGPDSQAANRIDRAKARFPNAPVPKKLPEGINENYARELMELHTLGVNGGYTQNDVIEVAKCLTGWTIDRPNQGGEFRFDEARHEPGTKVVLGKTIADGGEQDGLEVLHLLAKSPATAHFLSQKLAVRFVSDNPPAALVNRMAASYVKTNGDISAVLRTMFHSREFWAAEAYRAKVKTPLEFVTSAVRASGATVGSDQALVGALNRLGMPLYGMQTPNGYSWKANEWVSSNALVSRLNLALLLSGNRLPGVHVNWPAELGVSPPDVNAQAAALPGSQAASPDLIAEEGRLEILLLGAPAGAKTRAAVLEGVTDPNAQQGAERQFKAQAVNASRQGGDVTEASARLVRVNAGRKAGMDAAAGSRPPESPLATAAGLLLGSPEFQRR